MQSQWAHRKDERWLDSFSVCVCPGPWERERERETESEKKEEREREREREEREREREREKERKRKREKRGEREDSQDLPSLINFAPSCFFIFLRAKTNHFPANGSCDSALGRVRAHMHAQRRQSWRHHWGRPCTGDRMCASAPLSFMVGCVLYVFNAPFYNTMLSWRFLTLIANILFFYLRLQVCLLCGVPMMMNEHQPPENCQTVNKRFAQMSTVRHQETWNIFELSFLFFLFGFLFIAQNVHLLHWCGIFCMEKQKIGQFMISDYDWSLVMTTDI